MGAFGRLWKSIINFVMCLSVAVRPSPRKGQLGSHRTDFREIWYLSVFRKSVEKILKFHWNRTRITGTVCTWRPIYTFVIVSRSILLRVRIISGKISRENQNTCSITFSPPPTPRPPKLFILRIVWRISYNRTGHRWRQYDKTHAHCMPD
jgi:hypothetical protein